MFPNHQQYGQPQLTNTPYPHSSQNAPSPYAVDVQRARQNSDAMSIAAMNHMRPGDPESDSASPTIEALNYKLPEQHPAHVENGRTYHGFRRGVYMLPCDEQEQDRLDLFHKVITEARFENLLYIPQPKAGARVLDLGCGTGIWAIDVANKYPEAFVVGVDLSRIQPENRPKNCDFHAPWDYESPWASLGEDSWDVIHLQMGAGSVTNWPSLYRRILSQLRPGGWFEQVEIDLEPRYDGQPQDPPVLGKWYQYMKQATEQAMRPIAHDHHETVRQLTEAGFDKVSVQYVGLPLNPWPQDEHEKKVGRWYNLAISESLETLSLAPFSRVFGMSVEQIHSLAVEVKSEAYNKNTRAYNLLCIYQARKPSLVEEDGTT